MKYCMVALALTQAAFSTTVWTLEDCLKQAEKESLTLKVSKLSEQQADVSIKSAKSDRYPSLSANINNSLYDYPFKSGAQDHYSLTLGLNASMTLWDGGATSLSIETAQIDKQESTLRTESTILSLRESVLNAYYSLLANKESVQIAKSALEVSEADYENNMKLYEAGSLTRSNLVLSKADVAQNQVSVLTAEQTLDNSKTTLRQLLEIPRDEDFDIDGGGLDSLSSKSVPDLEPYEEIMTEIRQNYPALAADSLASISAQKNVKLAGKTNSITVTLGAAAETGLSAWESDAYGTQLKDGYNHRLTLGITIPIIDAGTTTNNVLSAQIESAQTEITRQETLKSLENSVEQFYLNAVSAKLQWEAAELQLEASEAAFQVAEDQKALGAITYTDYLEYKSEVDSAKLTLTQAKYTSLLANALLDLYRGKFGKN